MYFVSVYLLVLPSISSELELPSRKIYRLSSWKRAEKAETKRGNHKKKHPVEIIATIGSRTWKL